MDKLIVSFLIRAKQATYAGKGAETAPSRTGSHDLVYRENNLMYYDTYLGGDRFAGGITVAVLGTPIDQIYPRAHQSVARQIVKQNGVIVSEYAPGTKPFHKTSFLERNRLISGLSDIVVVVEAAERSGSLNTATHALEQGKIVFAVPGNITSPYSQGCNKLIKQGAIPYTEPDDILCELFPEDYLRQYKRLKAQNLIGDTDVETKILQALAAGFHSGEEIISTTFLPPEVFSETITLLEIKSRVHPLGCNRWNLI